MGQARGRGTYRCYPSFTLHMVLRRQLNFFHFLWVKVVSHLLLETHPSASEAAVFRDCGFLGGSEEAEGMSLHSSVARQDAPSSDSWKGPGSPSLVLEPPYPASQGLTTSFPTSAPGGCREQTYSHAYSYSYMLMLIHSQPKP